MMRSLKKMTTTTLTSEYDEGCDYDAQILTNNASYIPAWELSEMEEVMDGMVLK